MLYKGKYYDNTNNLKHDSIEGRIFYNPPESYVCQHYGVGANINVVAMYEGASNERYDAEREPPRGSYLITEDDLLFEKFRAIITLSSTQLPDYDDYELNITVGEYRELYETWRAEEEELASNIKE